MRKCARCLVEQEDCFFIRCSRRVGGFTSLCKKCKAEERKKYYSANAIKIKDKDRLYRTEHKDTCLKTKRDSYHKNKLKHRTTAQKRRFQQKKSVFDAYGGVCSCCGESNFEFLTVDHIEGGGTRHRRSLTVSIYSWLIKNNFPKDDFRVLCMNCNFSLGMHGYCPHEDLLTTVERSSKVPLLYQEGDSVSFPGGGRDGYCGVVEE